MALSHQLQMNFKIEYSGHQAFTDFANDAKYSETVGKSLTKTMREAASAEEELGKRAEEAGGKMRKAAEGSGAWKSFTGGVFSGGLNSLGPLGALFTSTSSLGWAGLGALIGDAIGDTVRYQHALVQVTMESERAAGKSKELYNEILSSAQALRINGIEAANLFQIAEQFKVQKDRVVEFVTATEMMESTLRLSHEEAAAFNYELTRLPGFTGPLAAVGSTMKSLTENFRVSSQQLVAGVTGSESLLFEVLPQFRTKAVAELQAATAQWSDLGAPDKMMNEIMLALSQFKWDPKKNILAMAGLSPEAARAMIQRGEFIQLSQLVVDALRTDVKRIDVAGRQEIAASLLGIDASSMLRIVMRAETAGTDVGKKLREAADKPTDYMEKRWEDTFQSIQRSSQALADALSNSEVAALGPMVLGTADALRKLSESVSQLNSIAVAGGPLATTGLATLLAGAGISGAGTLLGAAIAGGPLAAALVGIGAGAAIAVGGLFALDQREQQAFRKQHDQRMSRAHMLDEAAATEALSEMPGGPIRYDQLIKNVLAGRSRSELTADDMDSVNAAMADVYREWKEKHAHALWKEQQPSVDIGNMEPMRTQEHIEGHGDGALVLPKNNGVYLNKPVAERGEPEAIMPLSRLSDYGFDDENVKKIVGALWDLGEKLILNLKPKPATFIPRSTGLADSDRATLRYRS